jgi:NAD(P)H-nitrite reductase large subunit
MALLPNAFVQGQVAGINMAAEVCGGIPEELQSFCTDYTQAIPMNAIGFFGLHVISAGFGNADITVDPSFTEHEEIDGDNYRRLVFKDGYLVGFILTGDYVNRAGIYTSVIKERIPVDELNKGILLKHPQVMMFGKARRVDKLSNHGKNCKSSGGDENAA